MNCPKNHMRPQMLISNQQWCPVHGSFNDERGNYQNPNAFAITQEQPTYKQTARKYTDYISADR